jgi:hypothetical protein
MSETDAGKMLSEIRERVRVQIRNQTPIGSESGALSGRPRTDADVLESLRANLSVIERSWNKLPPVISYRRGALASLELSIKRLIEKVTHWFTWEQVNFNSATANSLRDALVLLSAHEEMLGALQLELQSLLETTAEIQTRLEMRAPIAKSANAAPGQDSSESVTNTETSAVVGRLSGVDAEINKLLSRLEELRRFRTRLDI